MNVWETLVRVLSGQSLAAVEANNGDILVREFQVANYNEVLALPGYDEAFTTLKALKRSIQLIEERGESVEVEIRLSLRVLAEEMNKPVAAVAEDPSLPPPNVLALESFIRGGMYEKRWSQEQRAAFDLRAKVITRWIDFFVSYTNRDAGGTNNQFKKLITSVFGFFPPQKERIKINYVARILAKFLEANNLRGFTDYKNIKCGDDIQAQVFEYCRKAFGFAQMVEPESFKTPTLPLRNWCYEEYQEFMKQRIELSTFQITVENKVYTVISTKEFGLLQPANLGAFNTWYSTIAPLKHVSLEGTDREKIRQAVREFAVEILAHKKTTIDAILAA
jgi:hypothetical protein